MCAIFWLKIYLARFLFWLMAGADPLRRADWDALKASAKEWVAACQGEVRAPTLTECLADQRARAFHAIRQRSQRRSDLQLGAQPCEACGEITHSWCETCTSRPWGPVCTVCDGAHRVCLVCRDLGLVWEAPREPSSDVVEVFGYHNEEGHFVELEEPLRIPRAQFDIIEASHIDTSELIAQLISELYTADGRRVAGDRGGTGA